MFLLLYGRHVGAHLQYWRSSDKTFYYLEYLVLLESNLGCRQNVHQEILLVCVFKIF